MDWSNLRGTAINNPPPKERDLDLIDYKIIIIIDKEMQQYKDAIVVKNNNFGKWIIK